jgi:hypothetical protein
VQCKFTSRVGKSLVPRDVADELVKARNLAERGLADNYVLMTNASFTGDTAAEIEQRFESIPGIPYDRIDRVVKKLRTRREKMEKDLAAEPEAVVVEEPKVRSIFDDVDE